MLFQSDQTPRNGDAARGLTVVYYLGYKATLEEAAFDHFHDQLLALGDEPGESDLFIDFGNVDLVSARTLGTLVRLRNNLLASGRHMTITNLCPQVYEVFAVTGLNKLLDLRLGRRRASPVHKISREFQLQCDLCADDHPRRPRPSLVELEENLVPGFRTSAKPLV